MTAQVPFDPRQCRGPQRHSSCRSSRRWSNRPPEARHVRTGWRWPQVEKHVDLSGEIPDNFVDTTLSRYGGDDVLDGMWRVDHVDQADPPAPTATSATST